MSSPTIRDVAKKAGVGIGTVSRVLNNHPMVTAATRKRVLEAIADLGFKPNALARQLPRRTRIQNIGVITQPFANYRSFSERLRGVQRAMGDLETEYELVLYRVSSLPRYEERLSAIAQHGMVDGLIIIDLDLSDEQKQLLQQAKIPFVGLNHFQNRDWPCIGANNIDGGYLATRHLLELDHTRIGYVGDEFYDSYGFTTSGERFQGYQQALEEQSINVRQDYVALGNHDYEAARHLAASLLVLPDRPTAIFAMSDIQALGCISAARDAGLRVPDDVSVIGYDDLEISFHSGLTTVRQHLELGGRIALEYLIRLMRGEQSAEPDTLPPLEVIARQTTSAFSHRESV
jgi:LacI family transcriptional regulator